MENEEAAEAACHDGIVENRREVYIALRGPRDVSQRSTRLDTKQQNLYM